MRYLTLKPGLHEKNFHLDQSFDMIETMLSLGKMEEKEKDVKLKDYRCALSMGSTGFTRQTSIS